MQPNCIIVRRHSQLLLKALVPHSRGWAFGRSYSGSRGISSREPLFFSVAPVPRRAECISSLGRGPRARVLRTSLKPLELKSHSASGFLVLSIPARYAYSITWYNDYASRRNLPLPTVSFPGSRPIGGARRAKPRCPFRSSDECQAMHRFAGAGLVMDVRGDDREKSFHTLGGLKAIHG